LPEVSASAVSLTAAAGAAAGSPLAPPSVAAAGVGGAGSGAFAAGGAVGVGVGVGFAGCAPCVRWATFAVSAAGLRGVDAKVVIKVVSRNVQATPPAKAAMIFVHGLGGRGIV